MLFDFNNKLVSVGTRVPVKLSSRTGHSRSFYFRAISKVSFSSLENIKSSPCRSDENLIVLGSPKITSNDNFSGKP